MKTLLLLLPLLGLVACSAEDYATPEEQATLTAQDAEIQELVDELKAKEAAVKELGKELAAAYKAGDQARYSAAMTQLNAALSEHRMTRAELESTVAEQQSLVQQVKERSAGSFFATIAPLIPAPLQPLLPFLGGPIAGLFFKRTRENMGRVVSTALKGNLADALRSIGASLGWAHTNTDPLAVMEGAKRAAIDSGDLRMAERISAATDAVRADIGEG